MLLVGVRKLVGAIRVVENPTTKSDIRVVKIRHLSCESFVLNKPAFANHCCFKI